MPLRFTRERKSIVPNDYIAFLQECKVDNEEIENDPINFHQSMESSNS